jgi:hypothetical protein
LLARANAIISKTTFERYRRNGVSGVFERHPRLTLAIVEFELV